MIDTKKLRGSAMSEAESRTALIDALNEIDQLRAELVEQRQKYLDADHGLAAAVSELAASERGAVTARAMAMEEAARWHEARRDEHWSRERSSDLPHHAAGHFGAATAHDLSAGELRALAPMPPGLVAVPVSTLKEAIEILAAWAVHPECQLERASLDALSALLPKDGK